MCRSQLSGYRHLIDLDFEEFIMGSSCTGRAGKTVVLRKQKGSAGGVPEAEIIALIKEGKLTHGASVWCKGMPDWMRIENTDLRVHLDDSAPPPLTVAMSTISGVGIGICANNRIFLESIVAGIVYRGNEHLMEMAMASNKFWYITIALNIGLSFWDERRLQEGGLNTENSRAGYGWCRHLFKCWQHNLAYFTV